MNRCTHAHIQTVVDIDTSFTLWCIPDGSVNVETNKDKMCEHCRKDSACRGSVCLPSCPNCEQKWAQPDWLLSCRSFFFFSCVSTSTGKLWAMISPRWTQWQSNPQATSVFKTLISACLLTYSIHLILFGHIWPTNLQASIPLRIASLRDLSARKC